MATQFFDESRVQSQIKSAIVDKYFGAWAKVIIPTVKKHRAMDPRILYVDLFAGPGRYQDGTRSTPLLILERAIKDEDLRQMLVTVFNDVDSSNTRSLESAIRALPGIETLRNAPRVHTQEVGEKIVRAYQQANLPPTLAFVDPWGYKGLSLQLVNAILKNWGCDCIFFFNYNRINMGLHNDAVREHMEALFGAERTRFLQGRLEFLSPEQRELTIVEELAQALKEMGGKYVLPFGFRNEQGSRTTHYLIFVSKHHRGYDIMKEIMAKESSRHEQGVPTFIYSPADERQPLLFEYTRPLDELGRMLLETFAGEQLTMAEVYEQHNVGRRYIKKNYKEALLQLEQAGQITVTLPPHKKRRRSGTFADDLGVIFPPAR